MMKALLLKAYRQLVYTDVVRPEPLDDQVLVRVQACAICGSDVHGYDGSTGRRIPPLIMGHEASGTIVAVGAAVKNFTAGERVTFDSTISCGNCRYCRRGEVNLCDNRRVLGVSTDEYRLHGAFADYVAVPERILYRLPATVSYEQGAMVEPVSIALHALSRTQLSLNDSVVVVGAGMIGLLIIQLLRLAGCGTIIAIDRVPAKLELAKQFGADAGLLSDDPDVIRRVFEKTGGQGADRAFEVVGLPPTLRLTIDCLRKGGSATLVGNLAPTAGIPLQAIVTRQITLYGSCASAGEYPACLDLIAAGKVDVDSLISATAPLADGADWFDRLYRGEPGLMKVILKP